MSLTYCVLIFLNFDVLLCLSYSTLNLCISCLIKEKESKLRKRQNHK